MGECFYSIRCESFYWVSIFDAFFFEEEVEQFFDVFVSFFECGHTYGYDVESVEQVSAEGFVFDHLFEIFVGSGHDSYVYFSHDCVADGCKCSVLYDA